MTKLPTTLIAAIALLGCTENTPIQSVEWYKFHELERTGTIAGCEANPDELQATQNCINAYTAEAHLTIDSHDRLELIPLGQMK